MADVEVEQPQQQEADAQRPAQRRRRGRPQDRRRRIGKPKTNAGDGSRKEGEPPAAANKRKPVRDLLGVGFVEQCRPLADEFSQFRRATIESNGEKVDDLFFVPKLDELVQESKSPFRTFLGMLVGMSGFDDGEAESSDAGTLVETFKHWADKQRQGEEGIEEPRFNLQTKAIGKSKLLFYV